MILREALPSDIPQLSVIRNSVKENALSNPDLITKKDYLEYLTERGKGWLCEEVQSIVGFAIVDLKEHNVWALFVSPDHERKGIGRMLHNQMLDWYFSQTSEKIWLGTAPHSRAARFYRVAGWTETGMSINEEIKFEMSHEDWTKRKESCDQII